jgi:type IV pilus assembly protein PilM
VFGGWHDNRHGPIGLDLGARSLRLMQLERIGQGVRVAACASQTLPAELPVGPALVPTLAPIVKQLLKSAPFKGRFVVGCIPSTAIQCKSLRLPPMPPSDLASAVEWEAADRLRLTPDSASVRFFDAGEVRQGDEARREIVALAASNEAIKTHLDLLLASGLEPLAIDAAPAALARALCGAQKDRRDEDPASAVAEVGYSGTRVVIARNGRVIFFKIIDIGGKAFDKAAADFLRLSPSEAYDARRKPVEPRASEDETQQQQPAAPVERAMHESMRGPATELGKEIALCLRYHSVTFRGRKPETLMLGGGEAQPRLAQVLAHEAGVTVEMAQPFAGIDPGNSGLKSDEPHAPWALSLGLAMRQVKTAHERGAA